VVPPVQPIPPHCPYSGTVPTGVGVGVGIVELLVERTVVVLELELDLVEVTGVLVGLDPGVVVGPPPPGTTVGTVLGCSAVFHDAVVGQGVVAIAATVVP